MVVGQEVAASGFNTKSNIKVAKLPTNTSKVLDFLIVCKLYMLSLPILKTILYNNNILYNSGKELSSMTSILFTIYFCSSDAIILELLKYSVFYSRDISIKLSLL